MSNKDVTSNFAATPAASANTTYDLLAPSTTDDNGLVTSQYAPFDNLTIFNTGSTNLQVKFNQQRGYKLVPSGTIGSFSGLKVSFISITNLSGTTEGAYTLQMDNSDTLLSVLKDILVAIRDFVTKPLRIFSR